MTKSLKEKQRLSVVQHIINKDFNDISIESIKLKLVLKYVKLKEPFSKEQQDLIYEKLKYHLLGASKLYQIFEFKVVVYLCEYGSILGLDRNDIQVYTYNGKKFLGRILFQGTPRIIASSTTGKILSKRKDDFLREISEKTELSILNFSYGNIFYNPKLYKNAKYIKNKIAEIRDFVSILEKNDSYNALNLKYNFNYNIDFNINLNKIDYKIINYCGTNNLSSVAWVRKFISRMNQNLRTDIKLKNEDTIDAHFIKTFVSDGIINEECVSAFKNDDEISLLTLIEYNDLLGY